VPFRRLSEKAIREPSTPARVDDEGRAARAGRGGLLDRLERLSTGHLSLDATLIGQARRYRDPSFDVRCGICRARERRWP
jgi:hypothetical protein